MGFELSLPLKKGTLEMEFDTVDELEEKLAALDVARIERAIASATRKRAPARAKKARGKKASPKKVGATKKGAKKKATKKRRT